VLSKGLPPSTEAFCFSLPLVPAVDDAVNMRKKEFLCFTRFVFLCTQLFQLDAQQRYFPPHCRYWIGRVRRLWRRKYAREGMNVGSSGMIRHAQRLPKCALQPVNALPPMLLYVGLQPPGVPTGPIGRNEP
jgi:hypothetical protein